MYNDWNWSFSDCISKTSMKAAAIWKVCLFHWRGLGDFYFRFVFRIRHGTSRILQILADAFLRQMEWWVGVGGTSPCELWFIKLGFGSLGPHQERYIYYILPWCQRSFTLSFLWELCAVMLCYVSVTLPKRLALSSLEFEWIQQQEVLGLSLTGRLSCNSNSEDAGTAVSSFTLFENWISFSRVV